MPSLPRTSAAAAGTAFLLFSSPLLLLLLLGSSSTQGASLREHRLRGGEPDPRGGGGVPSYQQSPNADMLKALEYIEGLRQRTGTDAQQEEQQEEQQEQQAPLGPKFDAADAGKLRAMLSGLASPAQSQGRAGQDENEEEEEEEEEREREEKGQDGEEEEEEKTQEWLQAVLSTLQQTEKASKPAPLRPEAALGKGQRSAATEEEEEEEDGAYPPWAQQQQQQHSTRSHRNHPLMFEEDEEGGEGEGEEQEQEQARASDHDSPFKRTNENVEEKYTPQNLATLQSVFEELGRLANAKAGHKRQTEEDEDDDGDDGGDDNDMFNARDLAYEDVAGGEEWAPLEEEEEEDERNRQEFNRGLDYGNDEEGEDHEEDDEEDEDTYPVKRSSQPGPGDDPDDITKLVDYYLLKVLEKTEEEEQKRELEEEEEEEEERAERRVAQSQYSDRIDPQAVYQLLQISQKLQIPPEDLLGLLKTEEMTRPDRTRLRSQAQAQPQPRRPNQLSGVQDKLSQVSSYKKNMSPPAKLYNRRPAGTQSRIPDDLNTEEILNILGLGSTGNSAPLKKQRLRASSQSRFYTAPARQGGYARSQTHAPYDDTIDEDELAAYLAAQMLALYPETVYNNKAGQKRASEPALGEDDNEQLGSFEQAMQDYFDRMDSDKSPPQKRQSETESMGGAPQTQSLDDEALMKILSYLNPESEESEDKDADAKTVTGM